jgi:multicomponent Na+:H+ antiporter subunit D
MSADVLVPLPVIVPLLTAALLAAVNKLVPRRAADTLAILAAVCTGLISGTLLYQTLAAPIVYWFGGWTPRAGIALGICFVATPMGAALAALACLLVAAAMVFSWRYFDSIGTLFHVLMMVFLAAMCGFSLTGDLFNLFVFFELMSAAGFGLCGYKIEEAGPLQGALNFAITNTIGAFLILSGIGLLYGRTGALNMAQIGRTLTGSITRPDGLVTTAFVFIMAGFFIKAAAFPFHFWLADAHAVAPTPVCVLFSGVMVELGIYAVARVYWAILDGPFAGHRPAVRGLLLGVGVVTALLGAVMCFAQRHIKRLLAFSTVSHVGLLIIGLGLLDPGALAGAALYVVGHGLIKAALFLCSGILLHRLGTVDELDLYARGRGLRGTAVLWLLGGLGLAGMPGFATFSGEYRIGDAAEKAGHGWIGWIFFIAAALTAGAVLRVGGHVFRGYGARKHAAITGAKKVEEKPETQGPHSRVPASMALPALCLVLLAISVGVMGNRVEHGASLAAAEMADAAGYQARVLDNAVLPVSVPQEKHGLATSLARSYGATAAAFLLAWLALRQEEPGRRRHRALRRMLHPLRALHSGHIGDYVAFLTFGVASFAAVLIVLLRTG